MDDTVEQLEYAILRKIVPIFIDANGCWFHKRKINKLKYYKISFNGKAVLIHHLSANLFLNFNKECKLLVCHKCDVPACFNPNHLFCGTYKDNTQDMINKGRAFYQQDVQSTPLSIEETISMLAGEI